MKKFLFILLVSWIGNLTIFPTMTIGEDAALGRQAEEVGQLRDALRHYVSALQSTPQGSDAELRLREKIIALAQRIQPPPAIPEEAQKFAVRGGTAIREAKNVSDLQEAITELTKALRIAPWWPDAYFNLGVAQERAGQLNEAVRSLKLYLLAAPNAQDARKVQDQIYSIEYRQEKAAKEIAAKARAEQERLKPPTTQDLTGTWRFKGSNLYALTQAPNLSVTASGDSLLFDRVGNVSRYPSGTLVKFKLKGYELEENSFRDAGIYVGVSQHCAGRGKGQDSYTVRIKGKVSEDRKKIILNARYRVYTSECDEGYEWFEIAYER